MRIHLISPTHYLRDGSLHKTTRYWTSGITLPYLKALTPPPNQVTFTDELMADLDLERVEREADVVGLTAMGPQIRRAYDLADHFRARGKQVVLGGTWVSLVPEESLRHADAVVAGEAEYVWQDVLADLAAGRSRGIYRAARWHDLRNLPAIDWWSLPLLKPEAFRSSWFYRQYFFWPVFFSRGCPHPCEYCAVQTYYRRTFRTRPVDDVLADVAQLRALGARARHPGDRAHHGRPRRRYLGNLRRHPALARGEQDQLLEAVHARTVSRHQVPCRHGGRWPPAQRRLGRVRLRQPQRPAPPHDRGPDAGRL